MLCIAFLLLVTADKLHSAAVTQKNTQDSSIVFPEEANYRKISFRSGKIQMQPAIEEIVDDEPEKCKGLTYCTVPAKDYPEKEFNEMYKGYKIPPLPKYDVLGNRFDSPDFKDDCDSEVTYEPLYRVREDQTKPWRHVIQAPDSGFLQKVPIATCKSRSRECFKPFLPVEEFITSCEQTYGKWEVVVKSQKHNGTETLIAKLPMSCSCKYRHIPFTM